MDPRYRVLFEPVRNGPVTAPNLFYQLPLCTGIVDRAPDHVAAMREMNATGGWGVVFTENIEISEDADIFRELVRLQKQSRRGLTAALGLLMALSCPPGFCAAGLLSGAKPTPRAGA